MAVRIFTINDFPTELIERFAPDLRPGTISTLRLVNRRFRDVFAADRFYRHYLCYPDRPDLYRHDSETNWRDCLAKEKVCLNNWRKGEPKKIETVKIPRELTPSIVTATLLWHLSTGESGIWALLELTRRKIALVNLTTPPILTVIDVSEHTSKRVAFSKLLLDQVLINKGNGVIEVFNILNDGNKLSLEHLFAIYEGGEQDTVCMVPLTMNSNRKDIYGSVFACYNDLPTDGVLRIWDVKRAVDLGRIDLVKLLSPKCTFELSHLDLNQASRLYVRVTNFPNIFVDLTVEKDGSNRTVTAVVDVERRECVLWFGELRLHHVSVYSIEGNHVVTKHGDTFSVFDLRMRPTLTDDTGVVFRYTEENNTYCKFLNIDPIMLSLHKKGKYEVVCTDGSKVLRRDISVFGGYTYNNIVMCAIGPFLVVYRDGVLCSVDMNGMNVMFHWSDLLPKGRSVEELVDKWGFCTISSIFKCVLVERGGRRLSVAYF